MSQIVVNLDHIVQNYNTVKAQLAPNTVCAISFKANAYGLGAFKVGNALYNNGCKHFFLATLNEAVELRELLPKHSIIYCLHGVNNVDMAKICLEKNIIPVLNSPAQGDIWRVVSNDQAKAVVHYDSGMNRLGCTHEEIDYMFRGINCAFFMSHLSCSDEPEHHLNVLQLKRFKKAAHQLSSDIKLSLANSCGIFLGSQYHFDMVRLGIALYGCNPTQQKKNPMLPVLTVKARILQSRMISASEAVGYNATYVSNSKKKLLIIEWGYADGYPRVLSNNWYAMLEGYKLPVVGRISMDSCTVDVSDVPDKVLDGNTHVEVINDNITVDDIAEAAGIAHYEVLTGLSRRHAYIYNQTKQNQL